MENRVSYREKNKSRCRDKVFEAIYKSGKNDNECFEELAFFEQQYSKLDMKDYIIRMRDIAMSYVINKDLKKEQRVVYVEGMNFSFDCIGKIRKNCRGILLNSETQLEFINDELERNISEKNFKLNKKEKELFKQGILASCAINFNIVDNENIISKDMVR